MLVVFIILAVKFMKWIWRAAEHTKRIVYFLSSKMHPMIRVGAFSQCVFQIFFILGMAAKEAGLHYSYSRMHLAFRIRILQERKEKD